MGERERESKRERERARERVSDEGSLTTSLTEAAAAAAAAAEAAVAAYLRVGFISSYHSVCLQLPLPSPSAFYRLTVVFVGKE
jgi:hypothetical protein